MAAARARGLTILRGLGELRVKESDRLGAIVEQMGRLGVRVHAEADDLHVEGGAVLTGALVESGGDHRMAMALGVVAMLAAGGTTVADAGCAAVSYPQFFAELARLSQT